MQWELIIALILVGLVLLVVLYYYIQFKMFKGKVNFAEDATGLNVPFLAPQFQQLEGAKSQFFKTAFNKAKDNPLVRQTAKKGFERGTREAQRRAEKNPKTRNLIDKAKSYQNLNAPNMTALRQKHGNELKSELKGMSRTDLRDIAEILDISTSGSKTQLRNRVTHDLMREKNRTKVNNLDLDSIPNFSGLEVEKTNVEYDKSGAIKKARLYLEPKGLNAPNLIVSNKSDKKNKKDINGAIITASEMDGNIATVIIAKTPFRVKNAKAQSFSDGTLIIEGENLGGNKFQFTSQSTPTIEGEFKLSAPINYLRNKLKSPKVEYKNLGDRKGSVIRVKNDKSNINIMAKFPQQLKQVKSRQLKDGSMIVETKNLGGRRTTIHIEKNKK